MLMLTQLLKLYGFDVRVATKLVRHRDSGGDVDLLHRQGWLETYQERQQKPAFEGADQLVSFLGRDGTSALFVGVYKVRGVKKVARPNIPQGFPLPQMLKGWKHRYDLQHESAYAEMEGRLVIDWGPRAIAWCQSLHAASGAMNDKPVTELLPAGYVTHWPGFADVMLRHDDLVRVVNNRDSHREWHRMLASVAAVYLILDTKTGDLYVGSAYGAKGLLGRWSVYARVAHGDNKKLKDLEARRPDFAQNLQFAVLQTLPLNSTAMEVIAHERRHKLKLGSKAHGLNSN